MKNEQYMQLAIEKAREGIEAGQTPFGACIVRGNDVIACAHNGVWQTTDITAHAEIQAIRLACKKLKTVELSGSIIYSTCEPCPMCFSAIHWARIEKIVYGASIVDAQKAGFNELEISNDDMKMFGKSSIEVIGGILEDECRELFHRWFEKESRGY